MYNKKCNIFIYSLYIYLSHVFNKYLVNIFSFYRDNYFIVNIIPNLVVIGFLSTVVNNISSQQSSSSFHELFFALLRMSKREESLNHQLELLIPYNLMIIYMPCYDSTLFNVVKIMARNFCQYKTTSQLSIKITVFYFYDTYIRDYV